MQFNTKLDDAHRRFEILQNWKADAVKEWAKKHHNSKGKDIEFVRPKDGQLVNTAANIKDQ
jgi:hypothetical protein